MIWWMYSAYAWPTNLGAARHAVICGAIVVVLLPVGLVSAVALLAVVIFAFLVAGVIDAGGVRPVPRAWRAGETPPQR